MAKSSVDATDSVSIETGEEEMRAIELNARVYMPNESDSSPRLTLTQQPAARRLMESLVGSRMPSEPLYDLPSWLEHSYPQFDANPKTPFFSWQVWSRAHLLKDKQRSLFAFHDYMSHDPSRRVILKRSNLELLRLWEWQHKRISLGLPPDLTPAEATKIKSGRLYQARDAEPTATNDSALKALGSPLSPPSAESSPAPLGGILGIIHQGDLKKKKEDKAKDLVTSHLSPRERSVIEMMQDPAAEVQNLAASFINRRMRGSRSLETSRSSVGLRVNEILTQELEKRKDIDILGHDGSSSGMEVKSQLYVEALKDQRARFGRTGDEVEDLRKRLNPLEIKKDVIGSKSWMETKLLNRNLSFLTKLDQSTHQKVKTDDALARKGSEVVGVPFDPINRPLTPTLDMVQEYLETRYADLLHQKLQASTLTPSLSIKSGQQIEMVSPDDSSQDDLNKAQAAFEAIRGPDALLAELSYGALMTNFHDQGLISQQDLSLCLGAAKIKAKEESASVSRHDLLSRLTGLPPQPSSRKLKDEEVDAAKALWEDSVKSSYSSWSSKLLLLAKEDAKKSSFDVDLQWISEPISFSEASDSWDRIVGQAGLDDCPSLAHIILQDHELRQSQAQPESKITGNVSDQSRRIYEGLLSNAKASGDPSNASTLRFDTVAEMNANLDLKDPSSFNIIGHDPSPPPPSPASILKAHHEAIKRSEQLSDESGTPAPKRLDDLWSQLKTVMISALGRDEITTKPHGHGSPPLLGESPPVVTEVEMVKSPRLDRPVVEFKQTILLGPENSEALDSKRVELRVKALGLKKDAGLTDAEIQLILDVCGEERWDERTQEIVLVAEHCPTREENRRLCFDQLMKLIDEARARL